MTRTLIERTEENGEEIVKVAAWYWDKIMDSLEEEGECAYLEAISELQKLFLENPDFISSNPIKLMRNIYFIQETMKLLSEENENVKKAILSLDILESDWCFGLDKRSINDKGVFEELETIRKGLLSRSQENVSSGDLTNKDETNG